MLVVKEKGPLIQGSFYILKNLPPLLTVRVQGGCFTEAPLYILAASLIPQIFN